MKLKYIIDKEYDKAFVRDEEISKSFDEYVRKGIGLVREYKDISP